MPSLGRVRALASALVAAALLPGCGGGNDPIPADAAQALLRDIGTVERRAMAGECRKSRATLRRLTATARGLPEEVSADVRATLTGGVDRLGGLVQTQCRQKRPKPKPKPEPIVEEPATPVEPTPQATPEPQPEPEPEPTPEPQTPDEEPQQEEPVEEPPPDEEPPSEEPPGEEPPGNGGGGNPCPPGSEATC